ncbi:hypothetical protein R50073_50670 (plasmid) [Maricurvus nonylphenolicus]|jgi:hypothetical protein|uniref:hypothetical protein n=1 Tax=Maricurvus nonylphenolicus TaxID=1008307 RepID=UPI0036F349B9
MLNRIVKVSFLVVFLGLLAACAGSPFYHENIMKGQVVGIDSNEVVVCIGSKDGAESGQELQVYRYIWEGAVEEGDDDYRVEYVGVVEINSVVNDHFARARVSSGDVRKNDMVEFKK